MRRSRFVPSFGGIIATIVVIFLWAPLLVVVLFSFHSATSLTLPFEGFSFRWYRELFNDTLFVKAIVYGLEVAATVTAVSIVLGVPAAYGLTRSTRWIKNPILALLVLPVSLPGVFLGVSLLLVMHEQGVSGGFLTVCLGQLLVVLPLVLVILRVAIERLDPGLDEVARDLGASSITTFRRVTLPLIWPVIAGAACLSFILSLDEFPVTFFTAGSDPTIPLYIYGLFAKIITPEINAVSAMLIIVSLAVLALGGALLAVASRRATRRRGAAATIGDLDVGSA